MRISPWEIVISFGEVRISPGEVAISFWEIRISPWEIVISFGEMRISPWEIVISFFRCGSLFLDADLTLVDLDFSPISRDPSRDDHTNDEAVSISLFNVLSLTSIFHALTN